jgi:hypothetical protein
MKNGAASGGGSRPEGDITLVMLQKSLSSRCQQQMQASPSQPRSATNINPWAGAIFWTTELTIRSELILTKVVPENTVAVRGFEHHTFICSGCHSTVV